MPRSTGIDEITDASTTHQMLSSHDNGMYTSVCAIIAVMVQINFHFDNKPTLY